MAAHPPKISKPSRNVLIYSEYVDNNGDLTFGCKLAANIASDYPDDRISVCTIPKMLKKNIANSKGMDLERTGRLKAFNEHNNHPVQHFDDYLKDNKNKLDMIIVGPVVMPSCVHQIVSLKKRINPDTKILLISEYGFPQESLESIKELLEERGFTNVSIQATGVTADKGIFVNQEIKHFNKGSQEEVQSVSHSLGNVGELLYGTTGDGNLSSYLASHDTAVHYSHNNAEKVVNIHTRYVSADKDTDLIVLGESAKNDRVALEQNIELLREKGFAKIVYIDAPNDPEVLFDGGEGPTYRIIHTGRVSLEQSIALRKISGEFSGATGDQSYSEALSRSPIVIYETQPWKKGFLADQIELANQLDPSGRLGRAVDLMGKQETTQEEYNELVHLLKQEDVKIGLDEFRRVATTDHCLQDKINGQIAEVHLDAVYHEKKGFSFSAFKEGFKSLIGRQDNIKVVQLGGVVQSEEEEEKEEEKGFGM